MTKTISKAKIIGAHALLVRDDGKVLMLKRNRHAPTNAGKWGLPGGTVEEGESCIDCLDRELHEELSGLTYAIKDTGIDLPVRGSTDKLVQFQLCKLFDMGGYDMIESDGMAFFSLAEVTTTPICSEHLVAILDILGRVYK